MEQMKDDSVETWVHFPLHLVALWGLSCMVIKLKNQFPLNKVIPLEYAK